MIQAKIILDSVNPQGSRITTWLLTYPRFIHSEFMTHRVFSRNSASSRAIPSAKLLQAIERAPATFEQVGRANKGMQAQEICSQDESDLFQMAWIRLGRTAIEFVNEWSPRIAKQVVNRAVEPWMHMTVLATATDHRNFFGRRAHPAADPNFIVLAYRMLNEYLKSKPNPLAWGEWHLPGLDMDAADMFTIPEKLIMCTALACRASYSAFEDGMEFTDAKRIHDQGIANGHWSPFEHPAQAIHPDHEMGAFEQLYPWSNFDTYSPYPIPSGWGQYRKMFDRESGNQDQLPSMDSKPDWVTL